MQENFGMGKHHQQVVFLGQRQGFALVQLVVVTGLCEEPLNLPALLVGLLGGGLVPVGQQPAVQLPEVLVEFVQSLAGIGEAGGQLLVVTMFMHPAER